MNSFPFSFAHGRIFVLSLFEYIAAYFCPLFTGVVSEISVQAGGRLQGFRIWRNGQGPPWIRYTSQGTVNTLQFYILPLPFFFGRRGKGLCPSLFPEKKKNAWSQVISGVTSFSQLRSATVIDLFLERVMLNGDLIPITLSSQRIKLDLRYIILLFSANCLTFARLRWLDINRELYRYGDDDNDNLKKTIVFMIKTTALHTLFSRFPWRPWNGYNVKPPNATFYGGRKHRTTNFPFSFSSWINSLRI